MSDMSRDIEGDYKAAYLDEYAAYVRDGRLAEAKHVAKILRDRYGVDLDPKPPKVETTAAEPPLEAAVPEKPKRGRPRKQIAAPDSE